MSDDLKERLENLLEPCPTDEDEAAVRDALALITSLTADVARLEAAAEGSVPVGGALSLLAEKDAKIASLQGERDRLRERVRLEGVCMSCLDGAPDLSHGCTDCLNTGYERGQSRGDEALTVLQEVKEWIDNWDPNFVQDDEWPETAARIRAALNPSTGVGEAG